MNLLIEFIKISKNLTAKSEAKAKREGNRRRFKNMWHRVGDRRFACTDFNCFLILIFAYILLVILQNPSE